VPQPPRGVLPLDADFPKRPLPFALPTAKAEYCCSSLLLAHAGHFGLALPLGLLETTRASKRFSQSWQTYSKMGMVRAPARHYFVESIILIPVTRSNHNNP